MFSGLKKYILGFLINCFKKSDPYPKTVAEVLDDDIKYKDDLLSVMTDFKKSMPYRGNKKQQCEKLQHLNLALSKVYGIIPPILIFTLDRPSCYIPYVHSIFLQEERDGKYSIVVFLHEFGHAIGKNEKATCKWSINLFRKFFPKSYGKLTHKGHLLYKKDV